jgi:hypothetical protein
MTDFSFFPQKPFTPQTLPQLPRELMAIIINNMSLQTLLSFERCSKAWGQEINESYRLQTAKDMPEKYAPASAFPRNTWKKFYFNNNEFVRVRHLNQISLAKEGPKVCQISNEISQMAITISVGNFVCLVAPPVLSSVLALPVLGQFVLWAVGDTEKSARYEAPV